MNPYLPMPEDIRDKPYLTQEEILSLNFIKAPNPYVFRRHYRAGLRSHIMAILDPEDVKKERQGVTVNGLRTVPKARTPRTEPPWDNLTT